MVAESKTAKKLVKGSICYAENQVSELEEQLETVNQELEKKEKDNERKV